MSENPKWLGFYLMCWQERTITGLANLTTELSGKQLEILREIIPKLSRLAVLRDLTEPGNPQAVRETDRAAQGYGIQRFYLDVRTSADIEPAFGAPEGRATDGRDDTAESAGPGGQDNQMTVVSGQFSVVSWKKKVGENG
jgi:hypothetical protein